MFESTIPFEVESRREISQEFRNTNLKKRRMYILFFTFDVLCRILPTSAGGSAVVDVFSIYFFLFVI
jgi:hypothetical protein